ncbi:ABC transporter substrate-binding protein [Caldimonas tepidiphila]|uniref:ABC transporter substrate-binding protein n=1 Tax=Caldimonas tepidiphila TaxID=2315841 RepID=UPI001F0BECE4|nr:ABC transporter substrate-binding protein [Caldimonas tepidiphila]
MAMRMFRLLAAAALFWVASASGAGEIVIGQSAPLSGSLASTGKEMALGARIYFDTVNAQGGIGGRKIRHVVKDDGYKTEETVRLTQELIEQDKAVGLIGYAGTGNISELLSQGVLASRNVPLVAPYTGGEPLRSPYNPYIFHIRAGYADEIERMVEQFTSVGMNRIAVFYQNDAFGLAGVAGAEKALAKRKLALVGRGSYEKGSEDVTAAVEALARTSPQAVLMVAVMRPAAAFVRQFRKVSPGTQIFSISVINGKDLYALAGGDVARGVGITQVVPSPFSGAQKVVQEYRAALAQHAPDAAPSYASFEMFLGAKVVVEGLRRVKGEFTPEALMKALETVDADLGGYGVRFGPGHRLGSGFVEVTLLRSGGVLGK